MLISGVHFNGNNINFMTKCHECSFTGQNTFSSLNYQLTTPKCTVTGFEDIYIELNIKL